MDLSTIRTPGQFIAFMETIWDMNMEPGPDGGITLHQHPQYNEYHDAGRVARHIPGMKRTGGHRDATVYRFQSGEGVVIGNDGGWIKLARNRYGHRR